MIKWTIDDFPAVRDFCRENEITFTLTYSPFAHAYKFVFKERWIFVRCFDEEQLDKLWIPALEKELINAIKKEFNIYETAVEAHDAMRDAELWGKFNKPLDEKVYTPNFKFDNVFNPYPYGGYNKIVKLYNERKDEKEMKRREMIAVPKGFGNFQMIGIKKVIFNDPATIIIWSDDVKTVVKAENEPYDPEKGMAIAIAKRALGNEGNYYNIFRKWIPKEEKKKSEVIGKVQDVTTTDSGVTVEVEVKSNIQKVLDVIDHPMDSFF